MLGIDNYRLRKRREALRQLEQLNGNSRHVLIIHYSCESFYDIEEGRTPRITSIAVRFVGTGQTKSFSIHKIAELKNIKIAQIDEQYDELEKEMLTEYFVFVSQYREYEWLHWNMRDINYGFEAIEHRFSIVNGLPVYIDDSRKHDMARLIMDIYGPNYSGHPRLEKLVDKNEISNRAFLNGEQEATAFKDKDFVRLHQSTLRKVEVLHTIMDRTLNNSLKTDSSFRDKYGLNPQGIFNLVRENWLFHAISTVTTLVIGALIGIFIGRLVG